MTFQHVVMLLLVVVTACDHDRHGETADPPNGASTALSPDQYRQRQQAIADSLLASARPVEKIVDELGQTYAVSPDALRDTIVALAQGTSCFEAGRNTDPYLAGIVNIMARMTPAGTDMVRVLVTNTRWTSAAGDLVNACLNTEMRQWKLDARYGRPAGYVVQVRFGASSR
ncbi:MAG: hypothetical protein ACREN6_16650 [Gemmatimonadaceae bacterium]